MNPIESLRLTRVVIAACPQQKMDEFTPDIWHEMLEDLRFEDCREAVVAVGRRQPFISPSEIRKEVQSLRDERIRRAHITVPAADANPDDIRLWLDSVRAENKRIAEGGTPQLEQTGAAREVAKMLIGTGQRMPHVPGSSDIVKATKEAFAEALHAKRAASPDESAAAS